MSFVYIINKNIFARQNLILMNEQIPLMKRSVKQCLPTKRQSNQNRFRVSSLNMLIFALLLGGLQVSFSGPLCECGVYIPNAFSPDGAGDPDNEIFRPYFPADCTLSEYDLKVFDRWGQLVFQSANPDESWDGTVKGQKLSASVYVYILKIKTSEEAEAKPQVFTGDVSLIRNR